MVETKYLHNDNTTLNRGELWGERWSRFGAWDRKIFVLLLNFWPKKSELVVGSYSKGACTTQMSQIDKKIITLHVATILA